MSAHKCHAFACERNVPRKMLMCRTHWYMVSADTRREVWLYYQDGQEDGEAVPTLDWHEAADKAIAEVREKEGV